MAHAVEKGHPRAVKKGGNDLYSGILDGYEWGKILLVKTKEMVGAVIEWLIWSPVE